jgi:ribosome recycling factor
MELTDVLLKTESQMEKSVEFLDAHLSKIRTGRASASLLDDIKVMAYGTSTPISQTATVSAPDARTLLIQPWDKSLIADIEKAILASDLGFNPQNDGQLVRVPIPALTEERRKEFVKLAKKNAEDTKIAIRNVRRDNIEVLRKAEKNKELSEDFKNQGETEIQTLTDKFIALVDKKLETKEKELMED